jgi:hypothetical protein
MSCALLVLSLRFAAWSWCAVRDVRAACADEQAALPVAGMVARRGIWLPSADWQDWVQASDGRVYYEGL